MSSNVASVFAARDPDLAGRFVLVVGLGQSGLAAARFAAARGARVTVADRKSAAELGAAADSARAAGATVHAGGHPVELAERADLVVVSPGVPPTVPVLEAARHRGVPVWGEIELAARFCRGRIVGVTGSNGKSTVTSMLGGILRAAGIPGGTGGNLATPLCDLLALDSPAAIHAVELSSFQLETVEALRPTVALLLNLSPDHLDRYPDLAAYGAAKARLLELVPPEGAALFNADDPPSLRYRDRAGGRKFLFSTRRPVDRGAFLDEDRLVLRLEAGDEPVCRVGQLTVRGEHNVANALAAALAARLVGCGRETIAAGLAAFTALPHRLQHVATVSGVSFYDDSKATNPDSTARALEAFEPGRVHLVLGGRDKGADWSPLVPRVRERARRVLLVGEAAPLLRRVFDGAAELIDCETVPRAVELGFAGARPGDVVLLAPGCASFDQYRNFEHRGDDFRTAVLALAPRGEPRG